MNDQAHLDLEKVRKVLGGEGIVPKEGLALAKRLKKENQFGYARKLLATIRQESGVDGSLRLKLAQQHALCTYKDPDLPTLSKLNRALEILQEVENLAETKDQETLGLAGAIYKRKWEADTNVQHLQRALAYYLRGFEEGPEKDYGYTGINAAFVLDVLAHLESEEALVAGVQSQSVKESVQRRRLEAKSIRARLVEVLPGLQNIQGNEGLQREWWFLVTLAEAHLGLQQYEKAMSWLCQAKALSGLARWEMESTARQFVSLARALQLGNKEVAGVRQVLAEFVDDQDAVQSLFNGKVGLALSGGGFRASLFHIGVLARLAELDMLRHVEVLSCVSGGSIVGAQYYLEIRHLLETKSDKHAKSDKSEVITQENYIEIVQRIADTFLKGVQKNLRTRVLANPVANLKMLFSRSYSRTLRLGELFEEFLYAEVPDEQGKLPRYMNELQITPKDHKGELPFRFHPKYDNWKRSHKVPVLVLNATTLNTGHNWQFTATYMGEPPGLIDTEVDGNYRLRRFYYAGKDTPEKYKQLRLGYAVAASACVPGLFEPIAFPDLYDGKTVRLVDGGVHDNQGVASLLEQGCTVVLVSDASGQMNVEDDPSAGLLGAPLRANSILQSRVRSAQYQDLVARRSASLLKGVMFLHLKKNLSVEPVSWTGCVEPSDEERAALNTKGPLLPYTILKAVQRGLAGVRTDLDSFSQKEAYALMASGYRMTDKEFPQCIQGFSTIDNRQNWKFMAIKPEIEEPGLAGDLLRLLEVGSMVAFKAWQLDPVLRWISYGMVTLLFTGLALMGVVHSEAVIVSARLEAFASSSEWTLTWGGLLIFIVSLVLVPFGGMKYLKILRYNETLKRVVVGICVALGGWIIAAAHLGIFDKRFLKYGRIKNRYGEQ